MKIFVQIASYCDPELVPTIQDCLAQAKHPGNITFGICWQHKDDDDSMLGFKNDPQFQIDDVRAEDGRGCCWARARVQKFYRGETYTLQLDSHHRFEKDWDETLILMMMATGKAKPIITAYAAPYHPVNGKIADSVPWKMVVKDNRFGRDGALLCVPVNMEPADAPVPARFLSGHFYFTLGQHCVEVPYDPQLYFHGEEPTMSARSYTHGYDLFHPNKIVVWHEYTRKHRNKHWDDFPKLKHDLDTHSKSRVRQLFHMEPCTQSFDGFGFGRERPLYDYERYAGIEFKSRRFHQSLLDRRNPPSASALDAWEVNLGSARKVYLNWSAKSLELPENCPKVSYFVENKHNKALWSKTVLAKDDFKPGAFAEFTSVDEPHHLIVWPFGGKKYSLSLNSETIYTTY